METINSIIKIIQLIDLSNFNILLKYDFLQII
jgi:hypothetical protein